MTRILSLNGQSVAGQLADDIFGRDIDAKLPSSSPLPAVLRCDGKKSTWVLYSFTRKLQRVEAQGGVTAKTVETVAVPDHLGRILGMLLTADGPVVFGERGSWHP